MRNKWLNIKAQIKNDKHPDVKYVIDFEEGAFCWGYRKSIIHRINNLRNEYMKTRKWVEGKGIWEIRGHVTILQWDVTVTGKYWSGD